MATFTATTEEFANPERGFYRWTDTNLDALTKDDLDRAYKDGYRLLYARLDISAYRGSDLSATLLTAIEQSLARARTAGVKLIVRAVYNYPESETEYRNAQDAPLAQVIRHTAQLKPLLQRNADVIAFVQAGFIGAWGEWHTSSNGLTSATNRTQVRDALLDAVPASRFIQLRYPPYVMDWAPTVPTLPSALSGSYRIGIHNDCFLASATDVGTFDDNATTRAKQRDYIDRLGDVAPFGGETCNPADESGAQPRSTCADILAEGAKYNLVYLNDTYYRPLFHDRWTQGNCMAEVRRKMGYRIQLLKTTHANAIARGKTLDLAVSLRNEGWARIFNPRGIQIVFKHATTGEVRRVDATGTDPRSWLPGVDQSEKVSVVVPADLAAGAYELSLALPDADARLAADARFSIRWANADSTASKQGWDAALGAFRLGTSVTVQ